MVDTKQDKHDILRQDAIKVYNRSTNSELSEMARANRKKKG